jgi:hypothetical protein
LTLNIETQHLNTSKTTYNTLNKTIMKKIIYAGLFLLSIYSNSAFAQCGPGNNISQLVTSNSVLLNTSTIEVGQTFIATCSGNIESITMRVVNVGVDGDHMLTMYDGLNATNPMDSVTFELTSLNNGNDVLVTFATPIPVVSGNSYAFMFKFVTGEASYFISTSDPYEEGRCEFHTIGNPNFSDVPSYESVDFYFIVHYQDNVLPVAVCENITAELDSTGNVEFCPCLVGSGSSDDSGILSLSMDTTFTCGDIGSNVVVLTVTDPSGNSATCSATVTVIDLLAPEIICPSNQDTTVLAGNNYTLPDYFASGKVTITDNCTTPILSVTQNPIAGTQLAEGVHTVTLTAVDEYENSSDCSFDVTVAGSVSLEEFDNSLLEFYPNPISNELNISNVTGISLEQATIYDMLGNAIITFNLNEAVTEQKLDLSKLNSGVYLVVIETVEGSVVKQIIKND